MTSICCIQIAHSCHTVMFTEQKRNIYECRLGDLCVDMHVQLNDIDHEISIPGIDRPSPGLFPLHSTFFRDIGRSYPTTTHSTEPTLCEFEKHTWMMSTMNQDKLKLKCTALTFGTKESHDSRAARILEAWFLL